MVGYAYMDMSGVVVYKLGSYIDTINPGFFAQNRHLILKHWRFDTEDRNSMVKVFKDLEDLKVTVPNFTNFIKSIDFDMGSLRNANKI